MNPSDIQKLAHLARLNIPEHALGEVAERLTNVLALADQLQAVDTGDVLPMAHPLDTVQRLRADAVTEPQQGDALAVRDAFLAIAPATEDGLYLVPKVLD